MKKLLLALSLAIAAGPVSAEFKAGSQTVAIFGGWGGSGTPYDYQPGNEENVTGGGGAFGAQYLYYLKGTPALAIGADITSSPNGNQHESDLLYGYNTTARVKSVVSLVVARLSYPRGVCRPYIIGGVGVHDSSQQLSAQPQPGLTWPGGGRESRMLIDQKETNAALTGGIGVDFFPTESFFLGFELRGTALFGLNTDDNPALNAAGFRVDHEYGITQGNIFMRAGVKFGA